MRTDTDIQNDVLAELSFDPAINKADIGVSVREGVVTLTGLVDCYYKKVQAEMTAKKIAGAAVLPIHRPSTKAPAVAANTAHTTNNNTTNILATSPARTPAAFSTTSSLTSAILTCAYSLMCPAISPIFFSSAIKKIDLLMRNKNW
jgi:hypothetical protein